MTKHLATFNVFRENDGALYVTVVEAKGVAKELHPDNTLPLYPFAMVALYEAVRQMQERLGPPSKAQKDRADE